MSNRSIGKVPVRRFFCFLYHLSLDTGFSIVSLNSPRGQEAPDTVSSRKKN